MTVANEEYPSDDVKMVNKLALDLFNAILSNQYKSIEQLVKKGRDKGVLNIKDRKGNTFLHLVVKIILKREYSFRGIPDIDDSAPLIQDVN